MKIKPEKAVHPESDEIREQMIAKQVRQALIGGWLFVVFGILTIGVTLTKIKVPSLLTWAVNLFAFAVIVAMLLQSLKISRYDLLPIDELERADEGRGQRGRHGEDGRPQPCPFLPVDGVGRVPTTGAAQRDGQAVLRRGSATGGT